MTLWMGMALGTEADPARLLPFLSLEPAQGSICTPAMSQGMLLCRKVPAVEDLHQSSRQVTCSDRVGVRSDQIILHLIQPQIRFRFRFTLHLFQLHQAVQMLYP